MGFQIMKILNNTPFEVKALPLRGPEGRTVLTVVVKGTFDICSGEKAEAASEQIPIAFGDEFYDEKNGGSVKFESDVAPFKPRADIVLVGKAYAPHGGSVYALDVSLHVGHVKKTIRVIGDRRWKCSSRLLPEHFSRPQQFSIMDLVYERAFGGIDTHSGGYCKENLAGRGFFAKKSKKTLDGALLPNLEDPAKLIKSWKDHPMPAGFGFYGKAWMPRAGYLGTYDDKWRLEHSPDPPEDFRFDYYNGAHPDLQVKGYLKCDEEVELVNLTPEGTVRFHLPGIRVNCAVSKSFEHLFADESALGASKGDDLDAVEQDGINEELEEGKEIEEAEEASPVSEKVELKPDTLCLIPDEKRFYLVWRGLCPINDLSALEVNTIEVW